MADLFFIGPRHYHLGIADGTEALGLAAYGVVGLSAILLAKAYWAVRSRLEWEAQKRHLAEAGRRAEEGRLRATLDGIGEGYRHGRHPDARTAKPAAKLLRALADELER